HMVGKSDTGSDWDWWLPHLLFSYRQVPQDFTGFSPFELFLFLVMSKRQRSFKLGQKVLVMLLTEESKLFSQGKKDGTVRHIRKRIPKCFLGPLKKEIDLMLSHGITEPSKNEWCNPVVLASKIKCCLDFRYLNAISESDSYPKPWTDDPFTLMPQTIAQTIAVLLQYPEDGRHLVAF
ncbi:hypothetical protein L3Q82_024780, partial [Scortum barcoo]